MVHQCDLDCEKPVQAMGIQRYIFFSIHNAEKHPEVPLMQVKTCTEKFLEQSNLDYTIFRLCGFMQARPNSWLPADDTCVIKRGCCSRLISRIRAEALEAFLPAVPKFLLVLRPTTLSGLSHCSSVGDFQNPVCRHGS